MIIEITKMAECHIEKVAELEKMNFSEPWTYQAFMDTLSREEYVYLVALSDLRVVGYAGAILCMDEGSITNIAIDNEYRRMGIAEELLAQLKAVLKKREASQIFLEVRESNEPARMLYTKCGYTEIGTRRNFYRFPQENAILMKCNID